MTINGNFSTKGFENEEKTFFMNLREVKGDVENIPDRAFESTISNPGKLKSISLPKVKEVGEYAFANGGTDIVDLYLPEVEIIDNYAFKNSMGLGILHILSQRVSST
ncbi:leucine-rich repeat protein [Bacillus cereus]|uniref:Uncharacterized protein n=1 Tax=Bacillus cereus TaxID=1396 RepID=A0A9X7B7N8_BACCE|nr:leucine-rich repeat protein [Bacillus cereus]PED43143.1 hypothetical protein CON26_15845 [Bacillus cereus]PFV02862.1 hypothetical protein COK98_25930 [Bacillus cereus]